uniref:Uncharacterized protein n=1 Tax=Arundo donax TaxID=35708 RepID=A0A0A9H349_ARUDO
MLAFLISLFGWCLRHVYARCFTCKGAQHCCARGHAGCAGRRNRMCPHSGPAGSR